MNKSALATALVAVSLLLLSNIPVNSGSITLGWDPSPDAAHVQYYMIHIGNAPGQYNAWTNAQLRTQQTVTNIMPGRSYYFAVTAVGTNGLASDFSNEVEYKPAVGAPSNLRIVPSE